MYNTVKELHIEIEQRINQITSNRHYSIAPEYIDMVLNRTAITYINTRFSNKTNYKREGFDESQKRVDDLRSLKRSTAFLDVIKDPDEDRGYILLPSDYLHLNRSESKVLYSKRNLDELKETRTIDKQGVRLDFSKFNYTNASSWSKVNLIITCFRTFDIPLDDIKQFLIGESDEEVDIYEFISRLIDKIRYHGLDAYWEHYNDLYIKDSLFIFHETKIIACEIRIYNEEDKLIQPGAVRSFFNRKYDIIKSTSDSIVDNDLLPSDSVRSVLTNFYTNNHRHLAPVTEIQNDKLYIYFGKHFVVSKLKIYYIKKPISFDIIIDQMSDLEVTPDFMDMVVSNLLLNLKDGSYQHVKQQSNLE